MSEENCTVEERLEDALNNQIAELDNVKPGSDEYTNISRAITDLYKVRNEQQKIESDYALATESQSIDREKIAADSEAKAKQAKVDTVGHAVNAGKTIGVGLLTAGLTMLTMAFENDGHIPGLSAASKVLTKFKIL